VEGRFIRPVDRDGAKITRIGAVAVAIEPQVAPAALLLPIEEALDRRARDDRQRHPLPDVSRIALPRAQKVGAPSTGPFALRTEHVTVNHQRLLVAKQPGEVGRPIFALKLVVSGHLSALGQRPALRGDTLDMATKFDFLHEQRGAGGAIFDAFIGYSR